VTEASIGVGDDALQALFLLGGALLGERDPLEQLVRKVRRNKLVAGLAMGLILAFLGGMSIATRSGPEEPAGRAVWGRSGRGREA